MARKRIRIRKDGNVIDTDARAAAAPDGAAHICSLFNDKDKDETGVLKRNKYYNKLMIHNVVITCCTLAKATFVFSLLFHAHCT